MALKAYSPFLDIFISCGFPLMSINPIDFGINLSNCQTKGKSFVAFSIPYTDDYISLRRFKNVGTGVSRLITISDFGVEVIGAGGHSE